LIGKKVIPPSTTYRSSQGFHSLKCSHKATEAIMYPLEKAFLILQKPPIYVSFSEIASITFSRVASAATTGTKFIEMKFSLTSGTEYSYSSIPREEHSYLEEYCRQKKLSVSSEIEDFKVSYKESDGRRKTIADYQDDLMGSESEDEDFQVKGDVSDVDEEFDTDFSTDEEDENGNVIEKTKKKRERESDGGESSEGEAVSESKPKKKTSTPATGSAPSSPKPKKKKKKEGPKRALTSFIYFSNAKRVEIKAQHPEYSIGDVAKELGALWKVATAEDKEPFEAMAGEDKIRYQKELEEFKKTGILPGASRPSSSVAGSSSSAKPPVKVKAEKEAVGKKSELSKEFVGDSDEDDF
jgi:structure-specific recognition protein 1